MQIDTKIRIESGDRFTSTHTHTHIHDSQIENQRRNIQRRKILNRTDSMQNHSKTKLNTKKRRCRMRTNMHK